MDEMDFAQAAVDDMREYHVRCARYCRPALPALGSCLYCGIRLAPGERWCDVECRDDWERSQAIRGIRG